jgi:dephospho-CoA kinase
MSKPRQIIVGITGGIGSGKTTVCRIFESLGLPVFYADAEAKMLYQLDFQLQQQVEDSFGPGIFVGGKLQKEKLAEIVFKNPEKLQQLNQLIHPAVGRRFETWRNSQSQSPYLLKEAAILIESGAYKACDKVILVTAPTEVRLSRVVNRDGVTEAMVKERMERQMSDDEKKRFADFIVTNDTGDTLIPQVNAIHEALSNYSDFP